MQNWKTHGKRMRAWPPCIQSYRHVHRFLSVPSLNTFFPMALQPKAGLGSLVLRFLDHEQLQRHTERHIHTRQDFPGPETRPSQRPPPIRHTTLTRDKHTCHLRDMNPRSQQSSGCRPMP